MFPKVKYEQGMSFIAGVFVLLTNEEVIQSFILFFAAFSPEHLRLKNEPGRVLDVCSVNAQVLRCGNVQNWDACAEQVHQTF